MKILMFGKAYFPHLGGVETVLRQLAVRMSALGHEVVVLCFGERDMEEMLEGVRVVRIRPLLRVGSAPLGWRCYREYRRLSAWADMVHFHTPNPMGEIACLLAPPHPRTIVTYHGDAFRPRTLLPYYDVVMRLFLRRCRTLCTTSPNLVRSSRVLSRLGRSISVIPIGVDPGRFSFPTEEALRVAESFVEGLGAFTVLFAGRLVYYKGVETLLEALASLEHGEGPSVGALIVGSGPLEPDLKCLTEAHGISDRVRRIPPQPDGVYSALFRRTDCFVLPSLYPVEAFGIAMLEAMAAGLPVVSTELGTGTSWVNANGVTGLVVPPGDVEALADAIRCLRDDSGRRRRMGDAARRRVEELFGEERMIARYVAEMEKMYNSS